MFLPGLLAENRDGHGSLPRSRNLLSEKVFTRPSTLYGRERADIHHGPESVTPLEAECIGADQLPLLVFRLQLCGGPYIPIGRGNSSLFQWPSQHLDLCHLSSPPLRLMNTLETASSIANGPFLLEFQP